MANLVTLAKLRGQCRLYADQRPGGSTAFIPDVAPDSSSSGLNDLINLAIRGFYDLLISAHGHDYYKTYGSISIVPNTSLYNLPSDFYILKSISLNWASNNIEQLQPINSDKERSNYKSVINTSWTQFSYKGYRLKGSQIEFLPTPTTSITAELVYVPTFTDLVNDNDTFDGVNGWEKLIALQVASEMREIGNESLGSLPEKIAEERNRIQNLAAEREGSEPAHIVDVSPDGSFYNFNSRRRFL